MQTVFEIFDCRNGKTLGHRASEARARETAERCGALFDYLPDYREGFFVADMRDNIKAGPFANRVRAERIAEFENMASDVNSFRVVEHRL